ncbi:MAG: hypothetical protein HQL07_06075 [Nitrospirae bacterium]|nr:hypothetical protein [Magnetococcales bacterium]HAT49479.1 hypothetical protein [Alphaproteobacteria bacterium]
MVAFYRTTVKAIPTNVLPFLLLAVFGTVLKTSHGHLHPTQLPILTIALFGIGCHCAMQGDRLSGLKTMERWLAGLWLLFALFLALNNQTIYAASGGPLMWLNVGLWLNALMALYVWAGTTFSNLHDPHWHRLTLLALGSMSGLLAILLLASPNPNIDVFQIAIEAANYLVEGKNPYAEPLSDFYHGAYGYVPGYIYLPIVLITNTVAVIFLGDVRYTYLFSLLVILFFLGWLGRDRGLSRLSSTLLPLVWISFPVTLFVLEQAWNDTLLIAFCAPLAWSLNRQTTRSPHPFWIPTGLFLGLALGTKQYALIIAWMTFLYLWKRLGRGTAFRVIGLAMAVAALSVLPFLLHDPQAFIDHAFREIAGYRIRSDSMSWIAYILAVTGFETFGEMILEIYLLFVAVVSFWFVRQPRVTLFHWAWSLLLIYGGLFLFGKQAFCNYYYFLAFFVLLAILFAQGGGQDEAVERAEPVVSSDSSQGGMFSPTLFWFLLIAAVGVRVAFMDGIEFKEDEFNTILLAYRQVTGEGGWAQVGLKSSTGLYNPPFFVYLMALPVAFSTDPRMVTMFVAGFNLLGIFALYRLLKWTFSTHFAAVTTVLFAASPWPILYSRKIWAQDCLFTFMMALMAVLISLSERYRPWKVWLVFVLLAIVTQLHMSAWFLPPAILLFMLRYRVGVRWRDLGIGVMIVLVAYFPYLQFHMQTHFQNVWDAASLMSQKGYVLPTGNFMWMFLISAGLGYQYVLGNEGFSRFWDSYLILMPYPFFLLFLSLSVLGFVWVLGNHWPFQPLSLACNRQATRTQKTTALFLLILVTIQGCYWFLDIPSFPHYGIIIYPSLFVFAVMVLEVIHGRLPVTWRNKAVMVTVTGIVIANLYFMLTFQSFVRYTPQSITGDYGIPYFVLEEKWQQLFSAMEKGQSKR